MVQARGYCLLADWLVWGQTHSFVRKLTYSCGDVLDCQWYGHVLQKEDTDWVKKCKCIEYELEGSRPRGRPKRTWKEIVQKDCQACNLNKEDAMDRDRWKKLIKIGDDQDGGWVKR